eukprot:4128439-Alexandrium_andersonii.AAC.1
MSRRAARPKQDSAGGQGGGGPRSGRTGCCPPAAWAASSAPAPGCWPAQSGRQTRTGSAGAAGSNSTPNWAPSRT